MIQTEQLDAAIGGLVRALIIDERRLSSDLGALPFAPLDLEILSYLHRFPGSVAKDVAAYLGIHATTMQSAVDRLNRRGLIHRNTLALKGRAVALTLSDEGAKFRHKIQAQNLKNCAQILACIDENERARFIQHMAKIANAFSK